MCSGFRTKVSQVEMTMDLTEASVDFFKMRLQSTARRYRTLRDIEGWKTFYVGGSRSPWQVRIYQKQDAVVRFEFIFRIPFLRKYGIRRPDELLLLRKIDLSRLVWLREIDRSKLEIGDGERLENFQKRALQSLSQQLSASQFSRALRDCGIARRDLFVTCPLELKLRRLQSRLVW
jgi:hypothetical protein